MIALKKYIFNSFSLLEIFVIYYIDDFEEILVDLSI